ncbi:hypothetical protein QBC46DRAFT_354524 [Diplogelasinospora grovesii]|uniref:Uncharacterized protein n=1 Tax=Diplogelasinospora grovesii TaxID=303347 RepID=A0AAN6N6F5_9PEZI|nr:hypothetical protein QBC46DRAFT_354524 [Diplogelasinospora grovesii]
MEGFQISGSGFRRRRQASAPRQISVPDRHGGRALEGNRLDGDGDDGASVKIPTPTSTTFLVRTTSASLLTSTRTTVSVRTSLSGPPPTPTAQLPPTTVTLLSTIKETVSPITVTVTAGAATSAGTTATETPATLTTTGTAAPAGGTLPPVANMDQDSTAVSATPQPVSMASTPASTTFVAVLGVLAGLSVISGIALILWLRKKRNRAKTMEMKQGMTRDSSTITLSREEKQPGVVNIRAGGF